ncbi:GNAT family N-acetyltransferase [Thermicanus aegyptius]|uniref:GNAT family N-acetyltransferase n=1 Tax=Thermicanus aegyptius TaxID=94009 RepID=UPI0003FA5166|nr:GNAT family N-acetyltransferase [Thermicanus aegyptius]
MENMEIRKVVTDADWDAVMGIRYQVFVEEQQVPLSIEVDSWDRHPLTQFLLAVNERGEGIGCLRLRPYDETSNVGKVERVAVVKKMRGKKIGAKLMEEAERLALKTGFMKLKLNAQLHAHSFYEKLGYVSVGEVFEEAGIPHIAMEKEIG